MKSLCLPATLAALEPIGDYVVEATTRAGLDASAAYKLRLAVDEIATNIITHGYEEAGLSGDVCVSGDLSETSLAVVLEDSGVPFDPLSRPLPSEDDLNLPLEERTIGGLGIYLVLKGVDQFRYERVGERNRNIFVVNRPAVVPE